MIHLEGPYKVLELCGKVNFLLDMKRKPKFFHVYKYSEEVLYRK